MAVLQLFGFRWSTLPRCAGIAGGMGVGLVLLVVLGQQPPRELFTPAPVASVSVRRVPPPPPAAAPAAPSTTAATAPSPLPTVPTQAPPTVSIPRFALPNVAPLGSASAAGIGTGRWSPALPDIPPALPAQRGPDQPPVLLTGPELLQRFYPRAARQRRLEGRTVLRLHLDPRGRVQGIEVLSSQPAGVFDAAARNAAMQLRFQPAQRDGQPVAAVHQQELQWVLP